MRTNGRVIFRERRGRNDHNKQRSSTTVCEYVRACVVQMDASPRWKRDTELRRAVERPTSNYCSLEMIWSPGMAAEGEAMEGNWEREWEHVT